MRTAHLGELSVSRIGLGAMSMSGSYGAPDEAESIRRAHAVHPITALQSEYSRVARVEENVAADDVRLTDEQLAKLTRVSPPAGEHHNEAQMRMLDR